MSLVEVMIAMSVLSIVIASLALLSVRVAHQSFAIAGSSYVSAAVTREADRLLTLPFDSLPGEAGSAAVAGSPFAYTRVVAVDTAVPADLSVRLVIAPANSAVRPETVVFNRAPQSGNPFSLP